jgi:hypothetical protein
MRIAFALSAILLAAPAARAQTKEIDDAIRARLATVKYVQSLRQPDGGYVASTPGPGMKPSSGLRATSAAARALKYNGDPLAGAEREKTAAFVMSCYDPQSGGFADAPGGKPDVNSTSIGVMAAVEVGVPREKFRKAMDYLKEHAKDFEQVRLAAAAVEAWGVKDCPFDLKPWVERAVKEAMMKAPYGPKDVARDWGSMTAFMLRLGQPVENRAGVVRGIKECQRTDGGFATPGQEASDLETTYRVMRALYLLKEKPDVAKLRAFVGKCRNKDDGYGVKPGEKPTVGATYYASIVLHWLDGMEKK